MTCEETDMQYGVINTYMFCSNPVFLNKWTYILQCKFIMKYRKDTFLCKETFLCKLANLVYIASLWVFEKLKMSKIMSLLAVNQNHKSCNTSAILPQVRTCKDSTGSPMSACRYNIICTIWDSQVWSYFSNL